MLHFNHNIHHNKTVVKPKHYYYCRFLRHQKIISTFPISVNSRNKVLNERTVSYRQYCFRCNSRFSSVPRRHRGPYDSLGLRWGAEEIFLSRSRHIPSTATLLGYAHSKLHDLLEPDPGGEVKKARSAPRLLRACPLCRVCRGFYSPIWKPIFFPIAHA